MAKLCDSCGQPCKREVVCCLVGHMADLDLLLNDAVWRMFGHAPLLFNHKGNLFLWLEYRYKEVEP